MSVEFDFPKVCNSESIAVIDSKGSYTYNDLSKKSDCLCSSILAIKPTKGQIALLAEPGFEFTAALLGILKAGNMVVPLAVEHPPTQWKFYIEESAADLLIVSDRFLAAQNEFPTGIKFITIEALSNPEHHPSTLNQKLNPESAAIMLFTSGTTNKPKGVVLSHANVEANIKSMQTAWAWNGNDHILNVLPLHHTHGLLNVVCTSLASGAKLEFLPKFDANLVFSRFASAEITLFMAVPTIYFKLIECWEQADATMQQYWSKACLHLRLMISGSAALPPPILHKWQRVSGHILLERYGMTEIGMALSNPLHGERRAGHVGLAMPGMELRLVNEDGSIEQENVAGEIQVKGKGVFSMYFNNPKATTESFTADGWFKTGDIAEINAGYYRILGRNSVDIIKTGGYKVSALEIEEVLLSLPGVRECAVVGIPDPQWGEIIAAALVLKDQTKLEEIKPLLSQILPNYKLPRRFLVTTQLPRNSMGKLVKNEVKVLF
jgi:malonyl-CoA/methylmalonyl-CoA synthetase